MLNMNESKYYREQIKNAKDDPDEKSKIVRDYVQMCRTRNKNINLSGLDLSNVDLSGLDLRLRKTKIIHRNISEHGGFSYSHSPKTCKVYICDTNFQGANLSYCNFHGAKMDDSNIAGANITGAHGWPYKFYRDKIESSKNIKEKTKAIREYITNCRVNMSTSIDLSNLDLSGTDLSDLDLSKKKLRIPRSYVNENGTTILYTKLKTRKVRICNTNLQGANLSNCNFNGAKMSGVYLTGAKTEGVRFQNTEQDGWRKFYLEKIDACENPEEKTQVVREYILNCKSLKCKADLSKRDLSETDLSSLDLRERMQYGDGTFKVRMYKTNLQGANLTNSNFNGVNMKGSNLKEAKIEGAHLENTKQSIKEYKFYREQIELCINSEDKTTLVRAYIKTCYALNKSIDLNDLNLSCVDLSGLDLSKRKIRITREVIDGNGNVLEYNKNKTLKVSIRNTNLKGAILSDCNFTSADMYETNLEDAIIVGAIFDKTKGLINFDYNSQSNNEAHKAHNNCVIS